MFEKNKPTPQQPIGVFDSGMGGLTVLNALRRQLPQEHFIYLGDTARLPYGTKSPATVERYAIQMAEILMQKKVKLLVVACNTASTAALPFLQKQCPHIPVIGVVEPGARAAVAAATRHQRIAILATETTIKSGIYQKTILQLAPNSEVIAQPAGLLVALAEEGYVQDAIAQAVIENYLAPILKRPKTIDCLVLGCTHFPVFLELMQAIVGPDIRIVDSAIATAEAVYTVLQQQNLLADKAQNTSPEFLVTDLPERFSRVGELFFGNTIDSSQVTLIANT